MTRPSQVRRRGIVYGINAVHPTVGGVVVGYVGQTVQVLRAREGQHRDDQPWSDLIVGDAYVVEEGWWTCDELTAREMWHIARLRPLYNYTGNLTNPDRIPIFEARRQRQARDRARLAEVATWGPGRRAAARVAFRWRAWTRRQRAAVAAAAAWVVLAAAGLAAGLRVGLSPWVGLWDGAAGASALLLAGWLAFPVRGVRRTRRRRKAAVVVLAAAVVFVSWSLLPGIRPTPAVPAVAPR